MNAYKRLIDSLLRGRMAHADVFELGASPEFLFVLFGGSGVIEAEYRRRADNLVPQLPGLLRDLEKQG